MNISRCTLTGWPLETSQIKPVTGTAMEYEMKVVGRGKIGLRTYTELLNNGFDHERYNIAGICKHRTLQNLEPVLIDSEFLHGGNKLLNSPQRFEEKSFEFI